MYPSEEISCEFCTKTCDLLEPDLDQPLLQLVGDHCLVSVEEQDRLEQNPEGGTADQHLTAASIIESDFVKPANCLGSIVYLQVDHIQRERFAVKNYRTFFLC
jgi:hypothetical protein